MSNVDIANAPYSTYEHTVCGRRFREQTVVSPAYNRISNVSKVNPFHIESQGTHG